MGFVGSKDAQGHVYSADMCSALEKEDPGRQRVGVVMGDVGTSN